MNVPQLELVCFTTIPFVIPFIRYAPTTQTVHQRSLTEITEPAAIFVGMLTVAT